MEEWREVRGVGEYIGLYEVSNLGRIRTIATGYIRSLTVSDRGYLTVLFKRRGNSKRFYVHRLVANAFIPNPNNKRTVNHIDGNKQNNNVDNLEWATYEENISHSWKTGLRSSTKEQREAVSRLRSKPVLRIDPRTNEVCEFKSATEAAKCVDGHQANISACCRNKLKTAYGYFWKFAEK